MDGSPTAPVNGAKPAVCWGWRRAANSWHGMPTRRCSPAARTPPHARRASIWRVAADGLETPLPGSVNGECLEAACAVNVARGPGGGLARVSRE